MTSMIDHSYLQNTLGKDVPEEEIWKQGYIRNSLERQIHSSDHKIKSLDLEIKAWNKSPSYERAKLGLIAAAALTSAVALAAFATFMGPTSSLFTVGFTFMIRRGDKCGFEVVPAMMQLAFDVAYVGAIGAGAVIATYSIGQMILKSSSKLDMKLRLTKEDHEKLEKDLQASNKKSAELKAKAKEVEGALILHRDECIRKLSQAGRGDIDTLTNQIAKSNVELRRISQILG